MQILITFFLGLFIIAGAGIAKAVKRTKMIEHISISVAFGTMLALAAFELVPEAFSKDSPAGFFTRVIFTVAGILILKLLDGFIPTHHHSHGSDHSYTSENVIHIGIISSIAVILHNIIEGMAVYSISAESVSAGLMMAVGVGLHNIPMGMVIYSTLREEKPSVKTGIISAVAISTFAGGLIMAFLWFMISEFVISLLICLSLGMILYILLFELAPHMIFSDGKAMSAAGTAAGIAIILAGIFFE